ncbi:MAG: hypothetical protein ACRYG4_08765 [Janthinobacterium lividum]
MIGLADISFAYPLRWPSGRRRTVAPHHGSYQHPLGTISATEGDDALRRLRAQFWAAGIGAIEVTCDQPIAPVGAGHVLLEPVPADCGVAVHFTVGGDAFALACDGYASLANNIASIAAHIDALRWQHERGRVSIEDSLRGFSVQLPTAAAA